MKTLTVNTEAALSSGIECHVVIVISSHTIDVIHVSLHGSLCINCYYKFH